MLLAAPWATAAVPVEESVEEGRSSAVRDVRTDLAATSSSAAQEIGIPPTIEPAARPSQNGAGPTSGGGNQLSDLFYQMQLLQSELQDLRGLVEEQGYTISRLQRDQKEQYMDLDRRVMAISQNPGAASTSGVSTPGSTASTRPTPGPRAGSEREAYTQAFEAMRAKQFEASLQGFQSLVEDYPNGQYTPNAYYWIGELELVAGGDPEKARQSFMQVVKLYPDHQKAPDAMYKLGVVYHNLGDLNQAMDYLQRVQQQYPGSSAAGLAGKYAAELQ